MSKDYRFAGFTAPNYTQVPDELFDELAPELTEAELRVLLYVVRRTFGFKKDRDGISLSQLVSGIKTKDGRVLDKGTGMSRPGVANGVKGLTEKGVIQVDKALSEDGVNQVNVYRLRFREEGVVNVVDHGSQPRFGGVGNRVDQGGQPRYPGVVNAVAPQETVEQETGEQQTDRSNDSNGLDLVMPKSEAERIAWYVQDLARELHDQAPLKSSAARACRLYAAAGIDLDRFVDLMQTARVRTQRYTASIKAAPVGEGPWPAKPKMAYFFAVLEDVLGRQERSAD